MRRPATDRVVSAVLLAGVLLCALPWLSGRARLDAPATFGSSHAAFAAALSAIAAVDDGFARGDVPLLRESVTPAFLASLTATLGSLGQRLEEQRQRAGLGDELRCRPFRGGCAGNDRMVLGFDLGDDAADAGHPFVRGIKVVVMEWNGVRLLLHSVREHVLPATADPDAAFALIARSWLTSADR